MDVVAVRMALRCTERPLHWFFGLSIPFWVLTGLLAVGFVTSWAGGTANLSSSQLPVVALMSVILATHLLFVGLLAELIIRKRGTTDASVDDRASRQNA